jgi:hypothetical protein
VSGVSYAIHPPQRERARQTGNNQLRSNDWFDSLLKLQRELQRWHVDAGAADLFVPTAEGSRSMPTSRSRRASLAAPFELPCRSCRDAGSNRKGSTHAAVDRLQSFVRQVESGPGGGWYL